jgi:hypothetical protein
MIEREREKHECPCSVLCIYVVGEEKTHVVVPLCEGQRVGDRQPVPVHFEVSGSTDRLQRVSEEAAAQYVGRSKRGTD